MRGEIKQVAIVTDFGPGIYVGQMRARLGALVPEVPQIDLVQDLPAFRPDLAAYLLPALARDMPAHCLYLCVVDPGVGGSREVLVARVGQSWLLGPDNGLLAPFVARTQGARVWSIGWRPSVMSASFHGRDWLVPAAARLCRGEDLGLSEKSSAEMVGRDWPDDLASIIYVDRFGNLMTGLRVPSEAEDCLLPVGQHLLARARTFCDVEPGRAFWYENALGLVEIAVNGGRADRRLDLAPGDQVGPLVPHVD